MSDLARTIEQARKALKKLKKASPHSFLQYQRLLSAESAYKAARKERDAARKAWKDL